MSDDTRERAGTPRVREIVEAADPHRIAQVRSLFRDYAESLPFDLCFQSFEEELANLPGAYSAPRGRLLLALEARTPAGCVAIRPVDENTAEMKRLYVVDTARGSGLGRALAERALEIAAVVGYDWVVLDTVEPLMRDAVALYRSLGFKPTSPYNANPLDGVLHMRAPLDSYRIA